MRDQWERPRGIYLRVWPIPRYERNTQARFRWQEGDDDHRRELRVNIARAHANIPMNSLQYRIWDELRADLALGERSGDAVWVGMAIDESGLWCQDHVFFCVMAGRDIREIISLHYDRWLVGGRGRADPRYPFVDWSFSSRRFLDLGHADAPH